MTYNPGDILKGRYLIKEKIGTGSMGEVYRAEHITLHKPVAIKLMHVHLAEKPEALARFQREAGALANLDNPHICQVTDFDSTESGDFYLVMEYLTGETLRSRLERRHRLDVHSALRIMRDLLSALHATHSNHLVHRDVKPDNIMLLSFEDRDDYVKLIDFGIVRMEKPNDGEVTLTKMGQVYGTPQYLSPEQVIGERVDHRADLYSCGCTLFEMLEGAPPFEAKNYILLLNKHLTFEPPHLTVQCEHAAELDVVIQKLLQKDRENRYQTARELRDAINAIESPSIPTPSLTVNLNGLKAKAGTDEATRPCFAAIPAEAIDARAKEEAAKKSGESKSPSRSGERPKPFSVKGEPRVPSIKGEPKIPTSKSESKVSSDDEKTKTPSGGADADGESKLFPDDDAMAPIVRKNAATLSGALTPMSGGVPTRRSYEVLIPVAAVLLLAAVGVFLFVLFWDSGEVFTLPMEKLAEYAQTECAESRISANPLIAKDPEIRKAAEHCRKGEYEQASEVFEKIQSKYTDSIQFNVMRAIATYGSGNFKYGIVALVALTDKDPESLCIPALRDINYALIEDDSIFDLSMNTAQQLVKPENSARALGWLIISSPCGRYERRMKREFAMYDAIDIRERDLTKDWLYAAVNVWRMEDSCDERMKDVFSYILPNLEVQCAKEENKGKAMCTSCYPYWKQRKAEYDEKSVGN